MGDRGHNRHGSKLGTVPLWGELGPHLIQCGRAEAYTCMPFILIHPTVLPQYTNVTDSQTGETGQTANGPIA